MTQPLDAKTEDTLHGGPSFSFANRLERFAFAVTWRLLAWILPPPVGWGWRRFLLRLFGASIGKGAKVYPSVRIWLPRHLRMDDWTTLGPGTQCYNMAPVTLHEGAIVSQRVFLCGGDHDHRDMAHQLVTRPITLGRKAWVAAEAFVGPGVEVGERAVLGARACATRDIPADTVWTGNPAQQVAERRMAGE
ncbi:LbetaH domain-containing protein [Parerythrobacter aestuarii]|uniref:putative colanic acid biosynthesis acetyltransferase n=1 Tax=Parerythrobacter aestuarii TaxID=3020909 RepID=UPI0024DE4EC2|nr:putative colanic acid biosynthesis acetyltransferase [Parerythrobacter aestuarii]